MAVIYPARVSWGEDTRAQRAVRLLRTFTVDPVRVSRALPGELRQAYRAAAYRGAEADQAWEEHLHSLLGAAWPCQEGQRLDELMLEAGALPAARGWGFCPDRSGRCTERGRWRSRAVGWTV